MFYYEVWLALPQNEITRIYTNHKTAYNSIPNRVLEFLENTYQWQYHVIKRTSILFSTVP